MDYRIIIKLIVPDNVVQRAIVDFIEGCTDRISHAVACTIASLLEFCVLTARIHILLAGHPMVPNLATKRTHAICAPLAAGERRAVELEDEPPIDGIALFQQR